MEYRVTTSEIPALCEDAENRTGLLVHIQPPVSLNSEAVERYVAFGDLQPLSHELRSNPTDDINDVIVLGSTTEQTTIYASLSNEVGGLTESVTRSVAKLLQFMGAKAIIE